MVGAIEKNFNDGELSNYLARCRVVVASSPLSSARTIRKVIMQLGAKAENVIPVETFAEAKKTIEESPTHLLISDLFFSENLGLELIEVQEAHFSNRANIATIMICADANNTSTGMIAEANVDAVLLKPFTGDSFKSVLDLALANKVKPSEYWKLLEQGKEFYLKKDYEKAISLFEASQKKDPSPTLSFYYLGLIHREKNDSILAIESFEEGLKFNPKDFRCLLAIFELHMEKMAWASAYEAAVRMHQDYPVSTKRILDLVKLSVYNKKFTDVIDYYQIFKNLEKRDPLLNRTVIAGMLVCARHFVLKEQKDKCLEILKDAARVASESETLRLEVLRYFVESGHYDEGEVYFNQLPKEFQLQNEVRLQLLDLHHLSERPHLVIQGGTQLLKEGIKTSKVYRLLIESSRKLNRSETVIQEFISEASTLFPGEF